MITLGPPPKFHGTRDNLLRRQRGGSVDASGPNQLPPGLEGFDAGQSTRTHRLGAPTRCSARRRHGLTTYQSNCPKMLHLINDIQVSFGCDDDNP